MEPALSASRRDNNSRISGMTWTMAGNQIGDLEYSYDGDGHVVEKTGSFAQTNLPQPVTGNTFNADNEMTAFNGTAMSYDANGNLTADASNTYAWDARNHLAGITGANTASFVYDSFGRRMSKTIGSIATSFLYDGLNPVEELRSGSPSANMLTGLGIDEYFQRTDASGASSYLTDALGSTLALANPAGGLATSYTYDPFGSTTVSGSSTNPFQFTGRENDGTGLYFYRARYYSPSQQRFVAQDPIDFRGGNGNLYAYVSNLPTTATDPLGLYLDLNVSYGFGLDAGLLGVTGGLQCDKCGCHPYLGGGFMTPGFGGSIMRGSGDVTPGLQVGFQGGSGVGGQFGFDPFVPDSFWGELGIMTPGLSATAYYVPQWSFPLPGGGCSCH